MKWAESSGHIQWHNERCIEIPLALDLLRLMQPGTVLDAGCAVNVSMGQPPVAAITHVTLSLADEAQWTDRTYVEADLRDLSRFPDGAFQRTGCVSTLEHVGMNNAHYGAAKECNPHSVQRAVKELYRVTTDCLFLTVPFSVEPWANAKWRYFTPETLEGDLMSQFPDDKLPNRTMAYYASRGGCWSGPYADPQVVSDDLTHVQQIVCLVLTA